MVKNVIADGMMIRNVRAIVSQVDQGGTGVRYRWWIESSGVRTVKMIAAANAAR